jgi:hypothetical protein
LLNSGIPKAISEKPTSQSSPALVETNEDLAELFIATVQGEFSANSCAFINAKLVRVHEPIARGAPVNLSLAASFVRHPAPLPESIEQWLISLFDQRVPDPSVTLFAGASACRIREIRRRRRGRPRNPRYLDWIGSLPSGARADFEFTKSETPPMDYDDLTMLHLVLIRRRPLQMADRKWIADILDPASGFDFQVNTRTFVRRLRGAKPVGFDPGWYGWDAAREVEELLEQQRPNICWEAAIESVRNKHGKSASQIESAVEYWRIIKNSEKSVL